MGRRRGKRNKQKNPKNTVPIDIVCPKCGFGEVVLEEETYISKELGICCKVDNPVGAPLSYTLELHNRSDDRIASLIATCDEDSCDFTLSAGTIGEIISKIKKICIADNPHFHYQVSLRSGTKFVPREKGTTNVQVLLKKGY